MSTLVQDPEAHYDAIIGVIRRAQALGMDNPLLTRLEAGVAQIHIRKEAIKNLVEVCKHTRRLLSVPFIHAPTGRGDV